MSTEVAELWLLKIGIMTHVSNGNEELNTNLQPIRFYFVLITILVASSDGTWPFRRSGCSDRCRFCTLKF